MLYQLSYVRNRPGSYQRIAGLPARRALQAASGSTRVDERRAPDQVAERRGGALALDAGHTNQVYVPGSRRFSGKRNEAVAGQSVRMRLPSRKTWTL